MSVKPLYEKIVLRNRNKQEIESATGLTYIKNMSISANTTIEGEVIAVGEGRMLADGKIIPVRVKVGDIVVYSKMQGESYNNGKEDLVIISESNILGIIEGGSNENN